MTAIAKLNQSDFDLYVTKYIAMSGLPFNHIDSDAFYSFIKQVAPKMKINLKSLCWQSSRFGKINKE